MSQYPQSGPFARRGQPLDYTRAASGTVATFMNQVYAWMCVGLALTAVVAWWTAGNPSIMRSVFSGGTFLVLVLIELGLVMAISAAINRISAGTATVLFLVYSALNGLTLSVIFVAYQFGTIVTAFTATAGMFAGMSLVGFITKRDLSGLGGMLFMGLIGLIIASVVNMFWANSTLDWIITYAGIFIFLGLTAYDTQRLKEMAYATEGNPSLASRLAISGSLSLYLDFINLFLMILRLLGRSRD